MNEFTMELMKIDERRSLVLWCYGNHKQFVVCSYYDFTKKVGEQWSWRHYFFNLMDAVEYAKETMK